jgi:aspartate/methionine/tyrosine aminotransferase
MQLSVVARTLAEFESAGFDVHIRAVADKAAGRDVTFLSLGDTDFDTPEPIVEAARRALTNGRTHYAPFAGAEPLRAAIARDQHLIDGQPRHADDVVVFQGAQSALHAAVRALADDTCDVMVIEPHYLTYPYVVAAAGARLVRVPVERDGSGRPARITRDRLERAASPRLRALIVTTPNNPSGEVLTREEVDTIAGFARDHDLWIISDEVYRTILFDVPFVSPAAHPALHERTIVVNSLSKSHAMTGWRVGWTVSPATVTPAMRAIKMAALFNSPTFIEDAAIEAFGGARGFPALFAAEMGRRRDALVNGLSSIPGVNFVSPEGGMFLWMDVSATGLTGARFSQDLYEATGISTVSGGGFGPSCGDFLRVSFGAYSDGLKKAAADIRSFVASIPYP